MNKLILANAFAIAGAAAFALPAFAQQPVETAQPVAAAQPVNAQPATQAHSVPPVGSRHCIRDTGSHITPPKGKCLPVIGTSYSRQDLQRTGAATIGGALQALDTSIVH